MVTDFVSIEMQLTCDSAVLTARVVMSALTPTQSLRNTILNTANVALRIDPFPSNDELNGLWRDAWSSREDRDFSAILSRSLGHVGAFAGNQLVGFVNVAWDGGVHAFILDTCVSPTMRRQGIATRLIEKATELARDGGAEWLHVDFEPDLAALYRKCGFRHTETGVIKLR